MAVLGYVGGSFHGSNTTLLGIFSFPIVIGLMIGVLGSYFSSSKTPDNPPTVEAPPVQQKSRATNLIFIWVPALFILVLLILLLGRFIR